MDSLLGIFCWVALNYSQGAFVLNGLCTKRTDAHFHSGCPPILFTSLLHGTSLISHKLALIFVIPCLENFIAM